MRKESSNIIRNGEIEVVGPRGRQVPSEFDPSLRLGAVRTGGGQPPTGRIVTGPQRPAPQAGANQTTDFDQLKAFIRNRSAHWLSDEKVTYSGSLGLYRTLVSSLIRGARESGNTPLENRLKVDFSSYIPSSSGFIEALRLLARENDSDSPQVRNLKRAVARDLENGMVKSSAMILIVASDPQSPLYRSAVSQVVGFPTDLRPDLAESRAHRNSVASPQNRSIEPSEEPSDQRGLALATEEPRQQRRPRRGGCIGNDCGQSTPPESPPIKVESNPRPSGYSTTTTPTARSANVNVSSNEAQNILADINAVIKETAPTSMALLASRGSQRYRLLNSEIRNTLLELPRNSVLKTDTVGVAKRPGLASSLIIQSFTTLSNLVLGDSNYGYARPGVRGANGGNGDLDFVRGGPYRGSVLNQGFLESYDRNDIRQRMRVEGTLFAKQITPAFVFGYSIATNVIAELADRTIGSSRGNDSRSLLNQAKQQLKEYGKLLAETTEFLSNDANLSAAKSRFDRDGDPLNPSRSLDEKIFAFVTQYVALTRADYGLLTEAERKAFTEDAKGNKYPSFGSLLYEHNKGARTPTEEAALIKQINALIGTLRVERETLRQLNIKIRSKN
jgi:hypothetical protein